MKSGIYRIKVERPGLHDKFYVGQAINMQSRKASHFSKLEKGEHKNIKLQRAYVKYGPSCFSFEIVLICSAEKEILSVYEQALVDFYGRENLYNINLKCIDSRLGVKSSEETKRKQSEARIGMKFSDETKRRISRGRADWVPPPHHLAMLKKNARKKGQGFPIEAILAAAEAKRGKKKPPEEIAKRQATRRLNAMARGGVY